MDCARCKNSIVPESYSDDPHGVEISGPLVFQVTKSVTISHFYRGALPLCDNCFDQLIAWIERRPEKKRRRWLRWLVPA